MSRENLEVVQGLYEAVNARDLDRFLAFTDTGVEFTSLVAEAEAVTYHGHEGAKQWWDGFVAVFGGLRFVLLEEVRNDNDRGVVKVRVHVPVQGVEIQQTFWQAFRFRNGKGVWWATFRTPAEALEAATVPE